MGDDVLTWEKLEATMAMADFCAALRVPFGQRWGEFEKDGQKMGAVLGNDNMVYVFPRPDETPNFPVTFTYENYKRIGRRMGERNE